MEAVISKALGIAISVDELGDINAQIAALKAEADKLKDYIKANIGEANEVRGERYKARIKSVGPRRSVSYKGVVDSLSEVLDAAVVDAAVDANASVKDGYVSIALYDL